MRHGTVGSGTARGFARCLRPTRRDLLRSGAALLLLPAGPPAWSEAARIVAISLADGLAVGSALTASAGRAPALRLWQGEAVELRWSSDRPMALHLHGYGLETDAAPGLDGVMSFVARAAGRFPVETHDAEGRHSAVLYVEVHPR